MNRGLALVCVVDDDDEVRGGMLNLLASAGYETIAFGSAEACIAFDRLHDVHLAVFDVHLPGMDGFALYAALRELGLCVPVMFISGHADETMARQSLAAGAIALLHKPVDGDTLLGLVERALGTDHAV